MNKLYPPTTKKVAYHSLKNTNKQIRDKTICRIDILKNSNEAILSDRLEKPSQEWDTERFLETNAATFVLLSTFLGYKKSKQCWFLFTGTVEFFLLQHAIQGWCPLLPFIRKFGVRTAEEINNEKVVYKKTRGDFLPDTDDSSILLESSEK